MFPGGADCAASLPRPRCARLLQLHEAEAQELELADPVAVGVHAREHVRRQVLQLARAAVHLERHGERVLGATEKVQYPFLTLHSLQKTLSDTVKKGRGRLKARTLTAKSFTAKI